jgi:isoleucyl-tRNA synthetase
VQVDGQALILAKDLVESVLKRANIADYTVLGTVKGDALELMRFKHPFLDFDVPAILGDHVTLEAGTGAVHTAGGHGPDDYNISLKYGLEIANPVGPDGSYLPGTYPALDGINVFKANDIIVDMLRDRGALLHVENAAQLSHAAGVTSRRSSSVRPRSGSSAWIRKACARSPERDQRRAVDPGLGPGAYRIHGG